MGHLGSHEAKPSAGPHQQESLDLTLEIDNVVVRTSEKATMQPGLTSCQVLCMHCHLVHI